jgi:hypothetical protein
MPPRRPPPWRAHDQFESLDVALRLDGKSSLGESSLGNKSCPNGILLCRLDLPRIERSAVGKGFNLRPRSILDGMSFGVHALCRLERHGRLVARAEGPFAVLRDVLHRHSTSVTQWTKAEIGKPSTIAEVDAHDLCGVEPNSSR